MHCKGNMATIRRNLSAISFAILLSFSAYAENNFNTLIEIEWKGSTFFTTMAINGIEDTFMVDTGAGKSLINREMFNTLTTLGDLEHVRRLNVRQADGKVLKGNLYKVAVIDIGDCRLSDAFVAYIPGIDMNLLGLNTLERLSPIVFDPWLGHILLSNCE